MKDFLLFYYFKYEYLISKKLKNDDLILKEFLDNAFFLKSHLMEFLSIEDTNLYNFLTNAKMNLANLHPEVLLAMHQIFMKKLLDKHLADLAAWHISSKDYIADNKAKQRFSRDMVLDFGGGIGTHALANAMSSKVEHVFFVDINQCNRDFVEFRAKKLGLEKNSLFVKQSKKQNV